MQFSSFSTYFFPVWCHIFVIPVTIYLIRSKEGQQHSDPRVEIASRVLFQITGCRQVQLTQSNLFFIFLVTKAFQFSQTYFYPESFLYVIFFNEFYYSLSWLFSFGFSDNIHIFQISYPIQKELTNNKLLSC